jgi:hypothetical protein
MNKIFKDDFSGVDLYNWTIEQHVPDGYLDFIVRNGALAMLDAGNRILPNIPELKTFTIKGGFETDWACNGNKFSLQIHFAYNRHKHQGTVLEISSDGNELCISLSRGGNLIVKAKFNYCILGNIIQNRFVNFEVEVNSEEISLILDSEKCFTHKINVEPGFIALGRGAFASELRLKSVEISTDDETERKTIWNKLKIPFAPINGMDNPIVWTVSATQIGNIIQMDVELSGGVRVRENLDWSGHLQYIDLMQAPYLRMESPQRSIELALSGKTLALSNPKAKSFYLMCYEKPEWPLKKTFFIERFDSQDTVLFCGYKSYNNIAVNKHQAAGQSETAYDCKSGKIIYSGEAIEPGSLVFDLKSPDDKQICRDIPKATYAYEKALKFAQENHYFSDNEDCSFHIELYSRIGKAKTELRLEYCLENAFFEPLGEYMPVTLQDLTENFALNIEKLRSEKITFGKLDAGVYHLRFRLFQGNDLLLEKCRAFEVSSGIMSGPQASRLPKLFSAHNEVMGLDTDYFDPWKADCVDVSHYISIGTTIMPHIAKEKRLWELYRLYKREWYLWLTSRSAQNWELSENRVLIEHCDYLKSFNDLRASCLVRLCCRGFYINSVRQLLYDFAMENNFHPEKIKTFIDGDIIPDKETFNELVEKHFYKWVDYFCEKYMAAARQKKKQIAEINSLAKYSAYGPVAIYAGVYKTAHSTRYIMGLKHSREVENIYNGFFILEDYPEACRYNINRGVFLLSGIKITYPGLKLYPEMYTPFGDSCGDAAVGRAWPDAGVWDLADFPVRASVKRALEYVYASVWHDGQEFNYWQDYGFHTRIWERERYEALLKTWGFVDKIKAARPLKANAFICNEACCENHAVYYDEFPSDEHEPLGDLFNTAEECVAYAYEMSRNAGQNAGFVADFKSLENLDSCDIDTLIIPPLTKVLPEDLANIRRLHEQGVSLLAFEEVSGLEELFGVKEDEERQVNNISVNKTLAVNPLMKLAAIVEYTEHRACKGKYRSAGADVLLDGEIPVLFTNKTKWGKTALYNVPPTAVRRQDQYNRVCYGRDSISQLLNKATQLILKYLSKPVVETDAGKIIAFKDTKGDAHIIIEEDAHPMPARRIKPLITLNLPGLSKDKITCDKSFSIVSINGNSAQLRVRLEPDEFAIFNILNSDR